MWPKRPEYRDACQRHEGHQQVVYVILLPDAGRRLGVKVGRRKGLLLGCSQSKKGRSHTLENWRYSPSFLLATYILGKAKHAEVMVWVEEFLNLLSTKTAVLTLEGSVKRKREMGEEEGVTLLYFPPPAPLFCNVDHL